MDDMSLRNSWNSFLDEKEVWGTWILVKTGESTNSWWEECSRRLKSNTRNHANVLLENGLWIPLWKQNLITLTLWGLLKPISHWTEFNGVWDFSKLDYLRNSCLILKSKDPSIETPPLSEERLLYIKESIKKNWLFPYYQKIVDREWKVFKYEVLVRWLWINGELLYPNEILLLSKEDIATELEEYYGSVFYSEETFSISFNLCADSIKSDAYQRFLEQLKTPWKIKRAITFEVLESDSHERVDKEYLDLLEQARQEGVFVAVDDFGAWFSDLLRVAEVEPDYIKIDWSYIKDILTNTFKREFIKAIIKKAKSINAKTIAERVETKELFEELKELWVDYFQWYYFWRPNPLDEIKKEIN